MAQRMREHSPIVALASHPATRRHPANPFLTCRDVPSPAALLFNPGVTKYQGKYVMVFRNDYGDFSGSGIFAGTNLGLAISDDGVRWEVQAQPCFQLSGGERSIGGTIRACDPRLVVIEGHCYLSFAVDTLHAVRGGIAVTEDFARWEILSLTAPDNRNLVLSPERVGGKYARLERPMTVYGRGGQERFGIWYSDSPDLRYWGNTSFVLGVEDVPCANLKIGPAAPPAKTPRGWLTTFHLVDFDSARGKNGWEARWQKRCAAGLMLLDLEDPRTCIGLCPTPLLAPEAPYETSNGFRNDVIFPCGMILEDDGEVKLYLGYSHVEIRGVGC